MHDPTQLPQDLPVPKDDGACDHLRLSKLGPLPLTATDSTTIDLASLERSVLFFYPRTGVPGEPPGPGFHGETWESIPGARGCTPQNCSFRDLFSRFNALGVRVLGVSTNTTAHQLEFKARAHIPFEFLSDASLKLTNAMRLPTFEFPVESGGPNTLLKRMAWYVDRPAPGASPRILKVWYPVFPPNENAQRVADWLERRRSIQIVPLDHSNPAQHAHVVRTLHHHWHGTTIHSRRVAFDAAALPGFLAVHEDGTYVGCITCAWGERELEVITLAADREGLGIGASLLDAAIAAAADAKLDRLFLTTTNDNLHAQEFYQRQGLTLVAIHRRAVDPARAANPECARIADNGLPIRDEWEYAIEFANGSPIDRWA